VKFSGYFPYTGRLILNGNEYAKRQAAKAGIGFVPLDNAFAAVDDVTAVQAICDGLDEEKITALATRLLRLLPYPFTAAGYRYELSVLQAEFSLTQMLDAPVTGRIFFDQLIRDNLDLGRPDRVSLIFGRRIIRKGKRATPGRFRTRVITEDVTPSLHVDYKHSKIKQYHKLGKALRTETTINDTADFGVAKGLSHLPELKEIGFTASRRLLDVQRISHDPAEGAAALAALNNPVTSPAGTRTAGMPLTSPRVQALLTALCVFRLLPHGFTNRDLRTCLAPLLGLTPEAMTSGQISYDLRRLRIHGLIQRIPRSFRYQVTPAGIRQAMFLTSLTQRLLITGLAQLAPPDPPAHSRLRAAARAYDAAIDDLARQSGLAA
jgi:Lon protease-like protein